MFAMMPLSPRFAAALRASGKHLLISVLVALAAAALVFRVWYPSPYHQLCGGQELFLLLVGVDVVCGPLLTLVAFNPAKSRGELWRDLGVIGLLQVASLAYGLHSVALARPVHLAFEGDRFRVVTVADLDLATLPEAAPALQSLSWTGPRLLGVRLARNDDPEFLRSIQQSMQGLHPAFRPGRWVDYAQQLDDVRIALRPLSALRQRHPDQAARLDAAIRATGLPEDRLGYLPLIAGRHDDWVVIVDRHEAQPRAWLPLDGW